MNFREDHVLGEGFEQNVRLFEKVDFPNDSPPSEDEPYMNPRHLDYFRRKLLCWREELLKESGATLVGLKEESVKEIDFLDQAALESNRALELKTRDRYRKLIHKIDDALERIENGIYGYCEETGEEIGIKRLEARPIATLSLEAQEWHETAEKQKRARY